MEYGENKMDKVQYIVYEDAPFSFLARPDTVKIRLYSALRRIAQAQLNAIYDTDTRSNTEICNQLNAFIAFTQRGGSNKSFFSKDEKTFASLLTKMEALAEQAETTLNPKEIKPAEIFS